MTTEKLRSRNVCPGCGDLKDSEIWKNRDKLFENISCDKCRVVYGRINGGQWHNLGDLKGSWDKSNESSTIHSV